VSNGLANVPLARFTANGFNPLDGVGVRRVSASHHRRRPNTHHLARRLWDTLVALTLMGELVLLLIDPSAMEWGPVGVGGNPTFCIALLEHAYRTTTAPVTDKMLAALGAFQLLMHG
jgi:hypothetical protein